MPAPVTGPALNPVRRRTGPLIALVSMLLIMAVATDQVLRSGYFTIDRITVDSALQQVDRGVLERSAWRSLGGNYLTVDLDSMERALEALPRVYRASIRRIWPDSLSIAIVETAALARFMALDRIGPEVDEYVNLPPTRRLTSMPVLKAALADRHTLIDAFLEMAPVLISAGLEPAEVVLTRAGDWLLRVAVSHAGAGNSFEILIGRGEPLLKIGRFTAGFVLALHEHSNAIGRVDMRYANGFAVQWRNGGDQNLQLAKATAPAE